LTTRHTYTPRGSYTPNTPALSRFPVAPNERDETKKEFFRDLDAREALQNVSLRQQLCTSDRGRCAIARNWERDVKATLGRVPGGIRKSARSCTSVVATAASALPARIEVNSHVQTNFVCTTTNVLPAGCCDSYWGKVETQKHSW